MSSMIDRVILLMGGVFALVIRGFTTSSIIVFICAVIATSLQYYFEKSFMQQGICILYILTTYFIPEGIIFLPLICYDGMQYREFILLGGAGIITVLYFFNETIVFIGMFLFLVVLMLLLQKRTTLLQEVISENKQIRDSSRELNLLLEKRNQDLLEKQDSEIYLATLRERNRIAREIHDNVGHLLSRSILMVGAGMAMNKDDNLMDYFDDLKNTLSYAMDSIRSSVHDLYDESIDLKEEVTKIIHEFQFCPIAFEYDCGEDVNREIKYCFIAIIKEALSNVIRHSNATKVQIVLREHPGFYQLLIEDNGTKQVEAGSGIGIENMKSRIVILRGRIHISKERGYRIFISIPKE